LYRRIPSVQQYAVRVQRRALGLLFGVLAVVFAATGIAALIGTGGDAKGLVVAVGALALGAWLGSLAVSTFRSS
jgi:fructose-1,6-bisphosphatase/sedoheptulose 1,7-bisphosphatase-like protein